MILQYISNTGTQDFGWVLQHTLVATDYAGTQISMILISEVELLTSRPIFVSHNFHSYHFYSLMILIGYFELILYQL